MQLIWFSPHHLHRAIGEWHEDLRAFFNIFQAFNPGSFVDRTGIIKPPVFIEIDEDCKIPTLEGPIKTYDDCCYEQSVKIMNIAKIKKVPIYLYFSGGLDSTTVMTAFLKSYPLSELKDVIKIVTSTQSWLENPNFIKKYLSGNFEFISAFNSSHFYDGRAIITTGEFNEHFFCFNTPTKNMTTLYGANGINRKYLKDNLKDYLIKCKLEEKTANLWVELIHSTIKVSPVSIKTMQDMFWWYNFIFNWQCCRYRLFALKNNYKSNPESIIFKNKEAFNTYIQHFFDSPEFQRWGLGNKDRSCVKKESRKYIKDFSDDNYFKTKGKFSSLVHVNKGKRFAAGITTDFKFIFDMKDIGPYYNPDNSFRS